MEIGIKLKELRLKNQLTQEELADRSELTKGYISQLENDLTSPSIATLKDILQALGSSLSAFFSEDEEEPLVFTKEDYFLKEGENSSVTWLVPTAQKNAREPIRLRLKGGAATGKRLAARRRRVRVCAERHDKGMRRQARLRGKGGRKFLFPLQQNTLSGQSYGRRGGGIVAVLSSEFLGSSHTNERASKVG